MKKKIDYQRLFAELGKDCCPICAVVEQNTERFLKSLLYENVTDVSLRSELKRSNGLCHTHAWRMQALGDPLAHAFIYGALLKSATRGITAFLGDEPKKSLFASKTDAALKKLSEKLHTPRSCMVCRLAKENEEQYLISFTQYADGDHAFAEKFQSGGFLCLRHTRKLLDVCGDTPATRTVLQMQLAKVNGLVENLDEITRKSDYRFTHEQWTDDEKKAWTRAVQLWNGEKE